MSYSNKNPAWHRLQQSRHDQRIQDEARIANQLQQQVPGLTRSEALRKAAEILNRAPG